MKYKDNKKRCAWVGAEPSYIAYHDKEWGVPLHDDRRLFELLLLEGAQAGLSWLTILKKRDNYRKAFDNFDPKKIALYDKDKITSLLSDAGIVRNRRKLEAAVKNAKAFMGVQEEFGTFDEYIWRFNQGKIVTNYWNRLDLLPITTPQAEAMSKDLSKRGFSFVGSSICYSFMQASGMVNDHSTDCFRHGEIAGKVYK